MLVAEHVVYLGVEPTVHGLLGELSVRCALKDHAVLGVSDLLLLAIVRLVIQARVDR